MEDDTTAADAQSGEIAYVGPVLTDSTTHALSFTPATLGTGDAAVQVSTKITIDGQKIKYNFASGVPAGNEPITITAKIAPLGTANAGLITTEIVFTVTPQGISAAPVVAITGNSTITVGDIAGTVQVGESNNTAYTYKWYASADTTLTDTEKETVLSTNWRLDLVDITALDDLADKEFVYLFCEVINTEEGKAPSAPVTSTGFKVTAAEPAPDPVADLATVTGVKNSLVLIALRPASSSSTWTQDNAETAIKGKANALANGCNLTYSFTSFEAGNLSSVAAGTITVTITITKNSQTVTTDSLTIPLQY
jgi:hypothetical protein